MIKSLFSCRSCVITFSLLPNKAVNSFYLYQSSSRQNYFCCLVQQPQLSVHSTNTPRVSITTTRSSVNILKLHTTKRTTISGSSSSNMGSAFSSPSIITYELLKKQNAETSTCVIEYFYNNREFDKLSKNEGELTINRDNEDGDKLQKGIDYAKSKGVIDPNYVPESYVSIDVLGKTPEIVADEILAVVKKNKTVATTTTASTSTTTPESDSTSTSTSTEKGSVIVIVGLSGTGKGTTVSCLRTKLETNDKKKVVTWSNGNIFRSVTLLAATWAEQNGKSIIDALTKENLANFMSMLSFGQFDDTNNENTTESTTTTETTTNTTNKKFDTRICGLGIDKFVSQIENTELKQPMVSKNIPTVAEVTQGEVILFAANAIEQMVNAGIVVLLEGREQTVNYVRSPDRFTLMLSDETLIGKRRAAQRIMGETLSKVTSESTTEQIEEAFQTTLQEMVKGL